MATQDKKPGGGFFFETIFWPWPAEIRTTFKEYIFGNGTIIKLIAEPTSQIRFVLLDESTGNAIYDELSTILNMPERIRLKMCFSWGESGITMEINGVWAIANKGQYEIPKSVDIKGFPLPKSKDLSQENKAAERLRASRLQSFRRTDRKKKRRSDGEAFQALRASAEQLTDAMKHIENGETHYIEQVVSLLRKIIATGDPLPLLQLVASIKSKSLRVFDDMEPPISIGNPDVSIKGTCQSEANELHPTEVDLDMWLDSELGSVGSQHFTHREAITKLGHTIGAHFSMDKWPIEDVLRAASSEFGGTRADDLVQYLIDVGVVVAVLSSRVLAD
jgi:hypothetical protein